MKSPENHYAYTSNEVIDLRDIIYILIKEKLFIFLVTMSVAILSLIYSLFLPNIYKANAVLVPVEPSSSISVALKNYNSIANLAGVSLPSEDIENNSGKAKVKMTSLSFFEDNIYPNIFLPDLMAFKEWDASKNIAVYNEKEYNEANQEWIRDFSYPQKQIPSPQESFKKFIEEHFIIDEDMKTGFLTISIKHQSPVIAQKWANLIVDEINTYYRNKDKQEAEKAVSYLNSQIAETRFAEIKQVMALLLQEEIQTLTLIEASDLYVFDYIDTPALMERKSQPRRAFICIIGTILGFMFSVFVVIVKYFVQNQKR